MSHLLQKSEERISRRAARWFVCLMVLGWVVLGAVDWYLRFDRYEWQTRWWSRPVVARMVEGDAALPSFGTQQVPASRGGDLTALIGIERLVARFAEDRPAFERVTDPWGYMNRPFDTALAPDVVVVGDSFMATGALNRMFASQLADLSEKQVYNFAMLGHGPFISPLRFLDDPRFHGRWPSVVVWGFAEREISGVYFRRFALDLEWRARLGVEREPAISGATPPRPRIRWVALSPRALKQALPDTSIIAQGGEWVWNRLRYILFRQVHPWVVVADGPVQGGGMLFYEYHIQTMRWSEAVRNPPVVADYIAQFDALCRGLGMRLIVVLIPEKEQVYRDFIPSHLNPSHDPIPPSTLWAVERELMKRNVPVVNMLPLFNTATARGELVYWRDDTHWNDRGINLAAEAVWAKMTNLQQGLIERPE